MKREFIIGNFKLVNNGYNNKVYSGNVLIKEFTDTLTNARTLVRNLNNK